MPEYDFAILGGGSAGYAAARTAVALGLKTTVIDGAAELGGLCILRGCMPSKTLIESANRSLALRNAAEFGIEATAGPVDMGVIRARKRRLIGEFASYRQGQLAGGAFDLLRGTGVLTGADPGGVRVEVALRDGGWEAVEAKTVLLATGSVAHVPAIEGLTEVGFWTSDDLLDAGDLPDSFVVLGGGAIALEMAHFLDGVGCRVTVLQRNAQLLTGLDFDLAEVVRESFVGRGIEVRCGTKLLRVASEGGRKRVFFERDGKVESAEAAEILVALGRRPSTAFLGLAACGIEADATGRVAVAPTQVTAHPRVFAAGDVCGPLEVVHLAIQQGEIAARNAAVVIRGGGAAEMDYRCKLFGVFTEPQVAVVGLSEAEARAQGRGHVVASYPFNDHGKSMVMGSMEGFVKLIADAETGVLLGGAVVGPEAVELIHEIAVALHLGATVHQLATAPHYHPTLSEIWTYPAEELAERVNNPG